MKYFFDLTDGRTAKDVEGVDYPNDAAVRQVFRQEDLRRLSSRKKLRTSGSTVSRSRSV